MVFLEPQIQVEVEAVDKRLMVVIPLAMVALELL
jgi:hypothetical protein